MNINFFVNNTFSCDMAIDPGTENTLIFIREKGIVIKEPSYVAYDINTGKIEAVGNEAKEMLGKTPPCIKVVKPINAGVISDFDLAGKMFKKFISSVCQKTVLKPRVLTSVPSGSTEVEKRAIIDTLKEAGAREVFLVEEPLAAASGAGCDISLARGMLIADIGGGSCDVASISVGRAVISKSITTAGNSFTEEVIKYVRKNHNLNIGFATAEKLKKEIGCAYPFELSKTAQAVGCDATTGVPRAVNINSEELREIFTPLLKEIAEVIKTTLEETPPELQSDILEDGILLTGGGALLCGIDKWLRMELEIKVFVTENMEECVINGVAGQLPMLDVPGTSADKYYYTLYR